MAVETVERYCRYAVRNVGRQAVLHEMKECNLTKPYSSEQP